MDQRLNRGGHLLQLMFWNCRHCGQRNYPKKIPRNRASFRLDLSCSRCRESYLPVLPPPGGGSMLRPRA